MNSANHSHRNELRTSYKVELSSRNEYFTFFTQLNGKSNVVIKSNQSVQRNIHSLFVSSVWDNHLILDYFNVILGVIDEIKILFSLPCSLPHIHWSSPGMFSRTQNMCSISNFHISKTNFTSSLVNSLQEFKVVLTCRIVYIRSGLHFQQRNGKIWWGPAPASLTNILISFLTLSRSYLFPVDL